MNIVLFRKKLYSWVDKIFVFIFILLSASYAQAQQEIEIQKTSKRSISNDYVNNSRSSLLRSVRELPNTIAVDGISEENLVQIINSDSLIIVAHRGGVVNDTLLENSIEGLEEAIRRGYTHLEVDLRTTKDGHVVCFHERNLSEITGINRNIDDLTLEELKEFVENS